MKHQEIPSGARENKGTENTVVELELGKKSEYESHYNPNKLFPIPRKIKRDEIGVPDVLPFFGYDIWNHYEVSWLNLKGKPCVAIAEINYSCDSPNIIESKSMKLYFNSLNNTRFAHIDEVKKIIVQDLSQKVGTEVNVSVYPLSSYTDQENLLQCSLGESIDAIDTEITCYTVNPDFLSTEQTIVEETLCSDLLKSNCLVTYQPDWGSIRIAYRGKKINREGLLKYIVSFRNHNEFHEQCIERIFMDIQQKCQPEKLTVYGRYTRRGGLDINPVRSTDPVALENRREIRQ